MSYTNMNGVLAESKITHGLDLQNYLFSIISSEAQRLKNQAPAINQAYDSKQRMLFLTDSYRKRYNQYLNIALLSIICPFIIFGVILLRSNFPIIPQLLIDIIIAVILTAYVISVMYIYIFGLSIRDKVDHDELSSSYLMDVVGSGITANGPPNIGSGNGLKPIVTEKTCVNDSCCDIGTKWCPASYQCVSSGSYELVCSNSSLTNYNHMLDSTGYPGLDVYHAK
jgi:hypothetical protein